MYLFILIHLPLTDTSQQLPVITSFTFFSYFRLPRNAPPAAAESSEAGANANTTGSLA